MRVAFSHIYCEECDKINPAVSESMHDVDTEVDNGNWKSADVACKVCGCVNIVLFTERD